MSLHSARWPHQSRRWLYGGNCPFCIADWHRQLRAQLCGKDITAFRDGTCIQLHRDIHGVKSSFGCNGGNIELRQRFIVARRRSRPDALHSAGWHRQCRSQLSRKRRHSASSRQHTESPQRAFICGRSSSSRECVLGPTPSSSHIAHTSSQTHRGRGGMRHRIHSFSAEACPNEAS